MTLTCGRGLSIRTYAIRLPSPEASGESIGAARSLALAVDLLIHGDVGPPVEDAAREAEELLHRLARAVRRERRLVGIDLVDQELRRVGARPVQQVSHRSRLVGLRVGNHLAHALDQGLFLSKLHLQGRDDGQHSESPFGVSGLCIPAAASRAAPPAPPDGPRSGTSPARAPSRRRTRRWAPSSRVLWGGWWGAPPGGAAPAGSRSANAMASRSRSAAGTTRLT